MHRHLAAPVAIATALLAACGSAHATPTPAPPTPTPNPAVSASASYCRDLASLDQAITHARNSTGGTAQLSNAGWALAVDAARLQAVKLTSQAAAVSTVSAEALSAAVTADATQDASSELAKLNADLATLPPCQGVVPAHPTPTPASGSPAADLAAVEASYMTYAPDRVQAVAVCLQVPYAPVCSGQWSAVAGDAQTWVGALPHGSAADAAALAALKAALTSDQSSGSALAHDYTTYNRTGVLRQRPAEANAFAAIQAAIHQLEQVVATQG